MGVNITPFITHPITPLSNMLIFGGSFDPVHCGHVAIVKQLTLKYQFHALRLIPTGNAWQKKPPIANAAQRVNMLQLAFEHELTIPFEIDQQEIVRANQNTPSYSVDTLQQIRAEVGNEACLVLLIGADQLNNLTTWKNWTKLFELAHVLVASRPNNSINVNDLPAELRHFLHERSEHSTELLNTPFGKLFIEHDLNFDIAATQIRQHFHEQQQNSNMAKTEQLSMLLPNKVLNYIQQQNLYH